MLSGSTKKKTIIGIDYSLTSPAVCVNGKKFYFLTSKKKWQDKWKLTDPETLKDLPDNPDQKGDKRKMLFGDFIKKANFPNL